MILFMYKSSVFETALNDVKRFIFTLRKFMILEFKDRRLRLEQQTLTPQLDVEPFSTKLRFVSAEVSSDTEVNEDVSRIFHL